GEGREGGRTVGRGARGGVLTAKDAWSSKATGRDLQLLPASPLAPPLRTRWRFGSCKDRKREDSRLVAFRASQPTTDRGRTCRRRRFRHPCVRAPHFVHLPHGPRPAPEHASQEVHRPLHARSCRSRLSRESSAVSL